MKRKVEKWLGQLERRRGDKMVERMFRECVEGNKGRGRAQKSWVDGS